MTKTITLKELKALNYEMHEVKDNSPRGRRNIHINDIIIGDKVLLNNYFTLVVEGVKSIFESVTEDYNNGKITLEDAADEFCEAGFTTFINTKYAEKIIKEYTNN